MRSGFFHIPGGLLTLARVGWLAIVIPAYALFLAALPSYFAALHHILLVPGPPFAVQLTPADLHTLQTWRVSLNTYAVVMVISSFLFQMCYAVTGVVLFWRRSSDWAALLASFALMMFPFAFADITLQTLPTGWFWLIPVLEALGNASLLSCAYIFPDGRFVPCWSRWLALALFAYWAIVAIFPSWQVDRSHLSLAFFIAFSLSALLTQLYRYRFVSTPRQRQQTKWVLFGVVIAVMSNIVPRFFYYIVLVPHLGAVPLAFALQINLIMFPLLALPITVGIAILSSRLWDIDVIINRTLVYGALTTILALLYVAMVFAMQLLLHGMVSRAFNSDVAVFSSTLTIAGLFQPLRRRLQQIIDRRFYRHKYDAARTLATLSATLRNEVDLSQLSEQLQDVVDETMQPTHVSLWLRGFEQSEKRDE